MTPRPACARRRRPACGNGRIRAVPTRPSSETTMFPSRLKLASYALVVLIGCLIAAPNLLTLQQRNALPGWLPLPHVTLGLDLRGGSHLVLAVDAADLARERLAAIATEARS